MPNTWFVLVVAVLVVGGVFLLLRDRKLREKYAALWLLIGVLTIALALFPHLLGWASHLVGVTVPSNLLFALAILLLLAVTLHLSLEISRLEDETRVLAEETAMLRASVLRLSKQVGGSGDPLREPEAEPASETDRDPEHDDASARGSASAPESEAASDSEAAPRGGSDSEHVPHE